MVRPQHQSQPMNVRPRARTRPTLVSCRVYCHPAKTTSGSPRCANQHGFALATRDQGFQHVLGLDVIEFTVHAQETRGSQ